MRKALLIGLCALGLPWLTLASENTFLADENITVDKEYPGDVYAFGNNIVVSGIIHGDLFAAGQNISMNGTVDGDVRMAGNQLTLDGTIGRNLQAAGNNILLKNVRVEREADLAGATLTIQKETSIGGQLNYASDIKATIENESGIQKGITWYHDENKAQESFYGGAFLMKKLLGFFGLLLVGIILWALFRPFSGQVLAEMEKPKNIVWGALVLFAAPPALIFIAFTLIGIPLSLIGLATYIVSIYVSAVFVGMFLGKKLLRRENIWSLILGIFIFFVLKNIPFFGIFIALVGIVWALGAMIKTLILTSQNHVAK